MQVDLKVLEDSLREDTALVSIMAVNNEIGVVQPIKEIGELCRKRKIFLHTDAAQAIGKVWNLLPGLGLPASVLLNADSMS